MRSTQLGTTTGPRHERPRLLTPRATAEPPDSRQGKPPSPRAPFPICRKRMWILTVATLGIRRESGPQSILQSCCTPLGYQGLLVSGQGGGGLEKKVVMELGGFIQSQSPSWGPGTLDLANPKGPPTGSTISLLEEVTQVPRGVGPGWHRMGPDRRHQADLMEWRTFPDSCPGPEGQNARRRQTVAATSATHQASALCPGKPSVGHCPHFAAGTA